MRPAKVFSIIQLSNSRDVKPAEMKNKKQALQANCSCGKLRLLSACKVRICHEINIHLDCVKIKSYFMTAPKEL